MSISYRVIWKLLVDRDIKKDLRFNSEISANVLAKSGKNDKVTMDVLEKICITLSYDVGDIMEKMNYIIALNGNGEGEV